MPILVVTRSTFQNRQNGHGLKWGSPIVISPSTLQSHYPTDTVNEICRIFENYKHEGSCQVSNEEAYFAKFLTSERLLTLQISDSNFRRHILVQILTLFQYLTADVKFKPNKLVRTDVSPFKILFRILFRPDC